MARSRRTGLSLRRGWRGRRVVVAALLGLGTFAGQGSAQKPTRVRVGTTTTVGRVSYVAVLAGPSSPWLVAVSGRRSLLDGRWDSVALDVARPVWSSSSGRFAVRATARYDGLQAPEGSLAGLEVSWQASRPLAIVSSYVESLAPFGAGARTLRFHSAWVGVRARLSPGLSMIVTMKYQARGTVRTDFAVLALR